MHSTAKITPKYAKFAKGMRHKARLPHPPERVEIWVQCPRQNVKKASVRQFIN